MWPRIRKLAIPLLVASLSTAGLAYAQMDDMSSEDPTTEVTELEPGELITGGDDVLALDNEGTEEANPAGSSGTTATGLSTEGCPAGFSGNHGQFVSSTDERPRREAAQSPCGKPLASIHEDNDDDATFNETEVASDDENPGRAKGHAKREPGSRGKGKGQDR